MPDPNESFQGYTLSKNSEGSQRRLRSHSKTAVAVDDNSSEQAADPLRRSSFALPSSPWCRRNSFLSDSMIHDETHRVYDQRYYNPLSGRIEMRYSVSLDESQGFVWNQDLFASAYQQHSGSGQRYGFPGAELAGGFSVGVTEVNVADGEDVLAGVDILGI
ncbi:hypothetical protein BABINDRAFT_6201 [Babjeviella inositovora NRRL Y-12698]|uniref:Uncharacterized protein n=1 Tax=Babjeviella inositovora NRRL Y-12698 TaxID=984486 RepID=A0A1E3QV11_9ASCO|nr:uncharacterized protein BABINDRAFT_6201 [Babjeviella inositovora NRRL Y-12698]ODQ81513.1 hypothetical protein BABINDRAFT_6201 [Babjeviella inositovora NRRL Y-12698]